MKKIYILALCFISFLWACEKPVFLPVKGSISGTVADNNGAPVQGVQVTAHFESPQNPAGVPIPIIVNGETDGSGVYRLENVWDKVQLKVEHAGFQPVIHHLELKSGKRNLQQDITLTGSPTVESIRLSKNVLTVSTLDTITIVLETQDLFNSVVGPYLGRLLMVNDRGETAAILAANTTGQSQNQILFQADLFSGTLPAGTYQVTGEVRDPDGNLHQAQADETIRVE